MLDTPVRVGVAVQGRVGALVPEAEVTRAIQVAQNALGGLEKLGSRARHGAAEHADRVGDIRPRVARAVQQRADDALIAAKERRLDVVDGLRHGVGDQ